MWDSYEVDSAIGVKSEARFDFSLENFESYFEPSRNTLGLDPKRPTSAKPGSVEKVTTLAARYAAGLPLWHTADCSDHSAAAQVEADH